MPREPLSGVEWTSGGKLRSLFVEAGVEGRMLEQAGQPQVFASRTVVEEEVGEGGFVQADVRASDGAE